jgi:hypothetical protein
VFSDRNYESVTHSTGTGNCSIRVNFMIDMIPQVITGAARYEVRSHSGLPCDLRTL